MFTYLHFIYKNSFFCVVVVKVFCINMQKENVLKLEQKTGQKIEKMFSRKRAGRSRSRSLSGLRSHSSVSVRSNSNRRGLSRSSSYSVKSRSRASSTGIATYVASRDRRKMRRGKEVCGGVKNFNVGGDRLSVGGGGAVRTYGSVQHENKGDFKPKKCYNVYNSNNNVSSNPPSYCNTYKNHIHSPTKLPHTSFNYSYKSRHESNFERGKAYSGSDFPMSSSLGGYMGSSGRGSGGMYGRDIGGPPFSGSSTHLYQHPHSSRGYADIPHSDHCMSMYGDRRGGGGGANASPFVVNTNDITKTNRFFLSPGSAGYNMCSTPGFTEIANSNESSDIRALTELSSKVEDAILENMTLRQLLIEQSTRIWSLNKVLNSKGLFYKNEKENRRLSVLKKAKEVLKDEESKSDKLENNYCQPSTTQTAKAAEHEMNHVKVIKKKNHEFDENAAGRKCSVSEEAEEVDSSSKSKQKNISIRSAVKYNKNIKLKDNSYFHVFCNGITNVNSNVFRTLADALASAQNGVTIFMHDGLYPESCRVRISCRIIGMGNDVELRHNRWSYHALKILADNVVIQNIKLSSLNADNNSFSNTYNNSALPSVHCLSVSSKNVLVEGCDIMSNEGHCIECDCTPSSYSCASFSKTDKQFSKRREDPSEKDFCNEEESEIIRKDTHYECNSNSDREHFNDEYFAASKNSNRKTESHTHASKSNNNLINNSHKYAEEKKSDFSEICQHAHRKEEGNQYILNHSNEKEKEENVHEALVSLTVKNSRIHHAANSAIFITGLSSVVLKGSIIEACGTAGIEVRDKAKVKIENSRILNCTKSGIFAHINASVKVLHSDINSCGMAGIELSKFSRSIINNSRIYHGLKGGIFVHDGAELIMKNSFVFANAMSNVDIRAKAIVKIYNSHIFQSRTSGIYLYSKGECEVRDSSIYKNYGNGIEMNNAVLYCNKNHIYDNNRCAIFTNGECNGEISENDLRNNKDRSIGVHAKGRLPEVVCDNLIDEYDSISASNKNH